MIALEDIARRLAEAVPGVCAQVLVNPSPAAQHSLALDATHALDAARWLRDAPELRLDYASNVTGLDWPDRVVKTTAKVKKLVNGQETELEEATEVRYPGCLEVVYHLYSMALKHGPVILRLRTGNRSDDVRLPSLTPVWRGCELQEREVYDLFGVMFDGHPDLRRLLMWEEFEAHPMRKDYVEPDDYEYEPTPHGAVLAKVRAHATPEP